MEGKLKSVSASFIHHFKYNGPGDHNVKIENCSKFHLSNNHSIQNVLYKVTNFKVIFLFKTTIKFNLIIRYKHLVIEIIKEKNILKHLKN